MRPRSGGDLAQHHQYRRDAMQVYTIYAPAHHTPGKVQATAAAAEADKDDEPAAWSVQPKHAPDKHG